MIRAINRLVILFVVGAVTSSVAFAETIKREITFWQPVKLGTSPPVSCLTLNYASPLNY